MLQSACSPHRRLSRQRTVAAGVVLFAAAAGFAVSTTRPSHAATTGCRVAYKVSSQWTGGFGADVTITNLGDPVNGWTLTWSFDAGQTVTQAWNATVSQSGPAVTARSVDYNAAIATNGSVSFGFNGSWSTSNPAPAGFALNGVACTGGPTSSPTPTPSSSTPSPSPSTPTGTPTVATDGTGRYRTVQAAVDAVPANNTSRVTITIKPGTYREIVTVPSNKPYITFEGLGSSAGGTVIVNNHSNAGGYGTFGSATVFVNGHDFAAKNLTISNDYGEGSQAVAANVNADRLILDNVRFLGNQDTLLVNAAARAYFTNAYIEGTVDFIFGDGTAVFHGCQIYERRSSGGPITAARTASSKPYGFLVYKSTITGATNNTTQLGRPWGPDAQVVYRESSLSATMSTAQPWIDMSGNSWRNARFFEYKNTGSGATVNGNRPQLSDAQAVNYTPQKYLAGSDGWNPIA